MMLRVLLTALAAVALAAVPLRAQSTTPDLVVVVANDLGWEDLAQLPTPHIDALAASGTVFLEHYADPSGAPTRFALNYGAYGAREGVGFDLAPSDPASVGASTERIALPRALLLARYRSCCFGIWGVTGAADAQPDAGARICGYQHWRAGIPQRLVPAAGESHTNWRRIDDGQASVETTYTTTAIVDAFVAWWSAPAGAPRLAYLGFPGPGGPRQAAPTALLPVGHPVPTTEREEYESAVLAFDHELGRLLAAIDLTSTVVVLTSDGGTPSAVTPPAGQYPGYGGSPFGGGVRVPLVVAGQGVSATTSRRLTHAVDLPATLLELAGRPTPPVGFEDGVSFAPDLTGVVTTRGPVLALSFQPNGAQVATTKRWCAVDDDGHALVWNGTNELYFDLVNDPFQTTPLPIAAPGTDPVLDALRDLAASIAP